MVAWVPILNVLPIVMEVIKIAKPVFTSNPNSKSESESEIIPKQISELQSAVTQNAESLTELATQLKSTIEGIDKGALNLQQELLIQKRLFKVSLIVSVLSISIATWALLSM